MAIDTDRFSRFYCGGYLSCHVIDRADRCGIAFYHLDRLLFPDRRPHNTDPTGCLYPSFDHFGEDDIPAGFVEQLSYHTAYQRKEYDFPLSRNPGELPYEHALANPFGRFLDADRQCLWTRLNLNHRPGRKFSLRLRRAEISPRIH